MKFRSLNPIDQNFSAHLETVQFGTFKVDIMLFSKVYEDTFFNTLFKDRHYHVTPQTIQFMGHIHPLSHSPPKMN